MKRGMTVKRMLAVMLGTAMLFTAVGVAGPMEVKAATHTVTFNLKDLDSSDSLTITRDVRAGDIINVTIYNNSDYMYRSSTAGIPHLFYPHYQLLHNTDHSVIVLNKGETWSRNYTVTDTNQTEKEMYVWLFQQDSRGVWNTQQKKISLIGNLMGNNAGSNTGGQTTPGTGASTDTKPATGKTEPSIPVHTHSYNWETLHEPTEEHDGEMVDICSVCGDIRQRVPITGFYLFQKETMDKIRAAAPNATVEVKTSKWISFHRMVMNALAERQDVTLKVSFLEGEYRGARKTLTIPAGTDTNALLNEDGYAGFKYLGGLFGLE